MFNFFNEKTQANTFFKYNIFVSSLWSRRSSFAPIKYLTPAACRYLYFQRSLQKSVSFRANTLTVRCSMLPCLLFHQLLLIITGVINIIKIVCYYLCYYYHQTSAVCLLFFIQLLCWGWCFLWPRSLTQPLGDRAPLVGYVHCQVLLSLPPGDLIARDLLNVFLQIVTGCSERSYCYWYYPSFDVPHSLYF